MIQENENILASASGDGSIKIWDLAAPAQANPLRSFEEHTREVITFPWISTLQTDLYTLPTQLEFLLCSPLCMLN